MVSFVLRELVRVRKSNREGHDLQSCRFEIVFDTQGFSP